MLKISDYIKKIRTGDGDKQIDYRSLANLPTREDYREMGLGNETSVVLTRAEYDALGDEKLSDGITYYISDDGQEGNLQLHTTLEGQPSGRTGF